MSKIESPHTHSFELHRSSSPHYLPHFQCYNLTIPSPLTNTRRYTRDGRHPGASILDDIVDSHDNELGGYSGYNEYNNARVATHVLRSKCEYSFYLDHCPGCRTLSGVREGGKQQAKFARCRGCTLAPSHVFISFMAAAERLHGIR